MKRTWVENLIVTACIVWLASLVLTGCSGRTQYTIKSNYVNSANDKESRTIELELTQTSYWKNAILVDFPRTIKLMNEEMIWRFKNVK